MKKITELSQKQAACICGGNRVGDLVVIGAQGFVAGFVGDYVKCILKPSKIGKGPTMQDFKERAISCLKNAVIFGAAGSVAALSVAEFKIEKNSEHKKVD